MSATQLALFGTTSPTERVGLQSTTPPQVLLDLGL